MQSLSKIIGKRICCITWILSLLLLMVLLTFQLTHERHKAYLDANRTFLQMEQILAENQEELVKIEEAYKLDCIHAAEEVSRILDKNPEAIYSIDRLKQIAEETVVDEIHIFDQKGELFSGTEPQYYGYTMDSIESMNFFKPMLTDKSLQMVQDVTENMAEGNPMQYSAVWNDSGRFIIQVGISPVYFMLASQKNDISYIFSLFRVNPNVSYYAIDEKSEVIIGSDRLEAVGIKCSDEGVRFEDIKNKPKGFYSKINGQNSFCVFKKIGSSYIGRIISINYLYQDIPHLMPLILAGLMIISFILTILIRGYMDRFVVKKIQDVIQKLKLIMEGNLEERVNVQGSLEFLELSSYINQMVQNLTNANDIEQHINKALRTALKAGEPEKSLECILEYLGRLLCGKRSYIFERNKLGGDDNTYEWVAEGVMAEKDNLQNLPSEVCEHWYKMFAENEYIMFENIVEMKQTDPLQYENLKKQGIVSIAVVPLRDSDNVVGFYGVDDPPAEMLAHTTTMLRVMGHFIEALLRTRDLVRNLKRMSYLDQLTQIGNRHALWEYIDKTQSKDISIGIIYCDITGLKWVNDNEGHEAGDRLILSACECMKKALHGYELFRLGGDELLAVCTRISEAELHESVKQLTGSMNEYAVVLAVGAAWKSDCTEGISGIMAEAENLMYKDKAAYYAATGIERRRQ